MTRRAAISTIAKVGVGAGISVVVAGGAAGYLFESGYFNPPPRQTSDAFVMGTKSGPGLEWIYIAEQAGFMQKYGITPTLTTLSNPATSHATLIAGQAQFEVSDLADEVIATKLQGIDTIMIGEPLFFSQYIFTGPKINFNDPSTLKGATIAISAPGDFIQMILENIYRKAGLNPSTDATFLAVSGGQPARIAAVKAGSAQIGTCSQPQCSVAQSQGLNVLQTWDSYGSSPKVGNTIIVQPTWLKNNRDVALSFLKAMVESFVFIYTNKEQTIKYAATWDGLDPVNDRAKIISSVYLNYIQGQQNKVVKYPFVDPNEVQLHVNFAAEKNPAAASMNVSTLYDNSLVQELKDDGFIDKAWSGVDMTTASQLWTSS